MKHLFISRPRLGLGLGLGLAATLAAITSAPIAGAAEASGHGNSTDTPTQQQIQQVAPALARYSRDVIDNNLWTRAALAPRDRALVTVAALIALDRTHDMHFHFTRALDLGVTPAELGEEITQLAFYAGWPNAMDAVNIARPIFTARGVKPDQLAPSQPDLRPMDKTSEKQRKAAVDTAVDNASPGLISFTNDPLFANLRRRPVLSPRDRSLVTVAALVATGQSKQVPYHLNRALDNGLKPEEASEILAQLAFYSGWPSAFSAVPVFKQVLSERASGSQE